MGSTTVQAPTPIDPAKVGAESLQTQLALAPQQFSAESQFAPQYAQLYSDIMAQQLPQVLQAYSSAAPAVGDLQASLNTAQRTADIGDVQRLGASATQAFQQANPQLMQLQQAATNSALNPQNYVSQLGQAPTVGVGDVQAGQMGAMMLGNAPRISAGFNPLLGMQSQQAAQQLAQGGQMSQYDQSQIANQVASQFNMYGRENDPITAATTALNLDSAQRARLQAAQANASGVSNQIANQQNMGMQAQQATGQLGYQYGAANQGAYGQAAQANLSAEQQAALANQQTQLQAQQLQGQFGLQYGAANQQAQYQNQLLNQNAMQQAFGIASSTAQDPYSLILGRSGGFGQLAGAAGQAQSFPTSTGNFNPFNQSIMDIYQGNNANQLAASTATANNNASMIGGAMSGLGALGGGLFTGAGNAKGFGQLFCWVAREVYGDENPRWLMFREWLMVKSPRWFLKLYVRYGERFAAFISNKPKVKSFIRKWMDSRIATMEVV